MYTGFPGGSDGKESACNEGDLRLIPVLGRSPGRGHGNPLNYSCLENPHGQRSQENVWASLVGSESKESACNAGDLGSIPQLGRFPGEGNSYSLQ